jgi:hypothetical protein
MTGRDYAEFSDGIWDDGEWISWDWINGQIERQEVQKNFPEASIDLIEMFEELVDISIRYKETTGRYLPLWGELGEIYAELKFGIRRHRARAQGSDGKLGDDFVEIKTITPEKTNDHVFLKRAGNFSKIVVVRIDEDFRFEARMIERKRLGRAAGKFARVSWEALQPADGDQR